jgi:hypothetical protein
MENWMAERVVVELIRHASPFGIEGESFSKTDATDWSAVVRIADENALAPLLYASLRKSKREHQVPADVLQELRMAFLRSNVANGLVFQELSVLLDLFAREGIPVVLLKGCALAGTLYPDASLRPMADLDLLVPRSSMEQVGALLIREGYSAPLELRRGFGQHFSNYRAFARGGNRPAHLEIHWHLFKSPYYCRRVPIDWFWNRTTVIQVNGLAARAFNLQAQVLHLCAHFSLHHRAERLIWSYDLALLLTRCARQIEWEDVLRAAEGFGLSQAVQVALARVRQVWQVPVPDEVMARLALLRVGMADRFALAMMTARRGEARVLLDGLSTPGVRGKLGFWWAHIFPAPEYIRERYRVPDARRVPLYYLWRIGDGVSKFIRSILSAIIRR